MKALKQNTMKGSQRPPRCPSTLRMFLHVSHHHLKLFFKKEEVKEDEPNDIPKILIPSSWVQKLAGWKKLKNKLEGDQVVHLQG